MVAYSPNFCLPCLEGTDSPCVNTGSTCEPSTVWCDLVNQVEDFLLPVDSLLSRTATAIPLASVTSSAPTTLTIPTIVAFDRVLYDTDNMVNLDLSPTVVTPRRSGVYMAYGRLTTYSEPAPVDGFEHVLTITSGTDTSVGIFPEVSVLSGSFLVSTQKMFRWELGVSGPFELQYAAFRPSYVNARLSVWWVCDL